MRLCCFLAPLLVLLGGCNLDSRAASKKYVDNGNKYFDRGKYKEASILYRRALDKDRKCADAWYRLGLTNMKLALYPEARKAFSRAMELDPKNLDALVKLGDLDMDFYVIDPQRNKALLADLRDLSQQLLRRDPKSYDGLRFAGNIAMLQRDFKTAIRKFEDANRSRPLQPELVLSLVEALFLDGRNDAAEKLAKDLIEKEKTFGPIYDLLYVYYLKANRPGFAEELLKSKTANNPSQNDYLLQLAFHYYMTNRRPEMNSTIARLTSDAKSFPNARMQVGDFFTRTGDLDRSLEQFELGQKENPKNRKAYQKKIVEVLGTQGKYDEASRIVASLLKEDSKDPEAIALHATLLLARADKSQAKSVIAELQPLVAKTPGNAILHFNLGRAYLANGDQPSVDQARVQFQEALQIDSKHVPARLSLAQLDLMRGDYGSAVQQAEQILTMDQPNLGARLVRARGLINMKEHDKARDELATVLKMYPKSNDARFELGELNFREKRYPEAEADFQILREAGDTRGIGGVIEAKLRQGKSDQAIQFVQELIRQSPDRADYRVGLANIYVRAGKDEAAAAQYQMLIDKNSKAAELYIRLGECRVRLGDFAAAAASFNKAKELAPNDTQVILDLAVVYDHAGRAEDARKTYEDVLKIQPDNATALNNLAYLKADGGVDLDQALAYAQRAQQKRPDDLNVIDTLGLIYIKKNLTEDGLRMLRDLVHQKPENPTYHLHLALALYQKGDRPTAKKELEAALRNKPTQKEQGKIRELLAKVG